MPTTPSHSASRLLFGALLLCTIVFSFGLGYQMRRWTEPNLTSDPPTPDKSLAMSEHIIRESQRIKQDEYVELRKAVERHREQAPVEQHAVIDDCLRVMRECRAERAKQRPVVLDLAEGK